MAATRYRRACIPPRRRLRGLTLIELVIVIAVAGIVVAVMSMFVVTPLKAYTEQSERAELADAADDAMRMLGRDLRAALPNSVRVSTSGGQVALELLSTVDGARYRDGGPLADPARWLDFTAADGAFATTVPFSQISLPFSSTHDYLAIYNVGVPGANAYELANVITPPGTSISIAAGSTANEQLVTLSPAFKFAWPSPGKRVYLVGGPVSYLCDPSSGTLIRYSGYAISTTQPTDAATLTAAGAASARVADRVSACAFSYAPGTAARAGLVTLSLTLATDGQQVSLLDQVHLVNAP
ncbi:MAG: type II secretion system protein [Gammaproteobacteria bacterium]|nr:type II secretion system protein [Gammaproteobacteria bacterium]